MAERLLGSLVFDLSRYADLMLDAAGHEFSELGEIYIYIYITLVHVVWMLGL